MTIVQTKRHNLSDPIATCGDRVYCICSQNGLFPDPWVGHVPFEMWGVWDHPIKLLDGFWFGLSEHVSDAPQWLIEADACHACIGYTEFDYRLGPLTITRRDFVPDGVKGMIVTLTVRTVDPSATSFALHALFRSDLRPAWLGEEADMIDGKDASQTQTSNSNTVCLFTDANNPWSCVVGADIAATRITTGGDVWAAQRTHGQGTSSQFDYSCSFDAAGIAEINFFIAGSAESEAAALTTLERLRARRAELLDAKIARCQSILQTSDIITPDAKLNAAIAWSKLICQMFARDVPKFGLGVGAGLPEYPWWFGIDAEYAALPMLQSGSFELVKSTLRLLKRTSLDCNPSEPGRVMHEMSTTGVVFNKGNMVEVPVFMRAVHQTWLWTGDRAFLEEMYPFCKRGLLEYALGQNDLDGDVCPTGNSIIETVEMHAGFECVDVASYTWEALTLLADMAETVGDTGITLDLIKKADALAARLREEWWLEDEGLFADVRASLNDVEGTLSHLENVAAEQSWMLQGQRHVQTARRLFEPYLARYADQPRDIDLPWLLRHWVVLCPVEVGVATRQQAERALTRLQSPEFCNEWGMVLHPERDDVMSINTGLLALAAARYGKVNDALNIVNKLTNAFSYLTPGAISEALPGKWCFLQLWSNVGIVAPVVECFLGIEPRAADRLLRVVPQLPADWDRAEVKRLRVGDTSFDVSVARGGDAYSIHVRCDDPAARLELGIVLPESKSVKSMTLNGKPMEWMTQETNRGRCAVCATRGNAELRVHF